MEQQAKYAIALEENKAPLIIAHINAPEGEASSSPRAEWLVLPVHVRAER